MTRRALVYVEIAVCALMLAGETVALAAAAETEAVAPAGQGRLLLVTPRQDASGLELLPPVLRYRAKDGEHTTTFAVRVKNTSNAPVEILQVNTSCGCTVARLPSQPWALPPGATGEFQVQVDFAGKRGTLAKTATIQTRRGAREVTLVVEIPAAGEVAMSERRQQGLQVATVDRQAVFRGECAACHVAPTVGLMGRELYATACGICHDAEHRASMVPDLRALAYPPGHDYWRGIVAQGRPGTLMPAFAQSEGGPLSSPQIESLVAYLATAFSSAHPARSVPEMPPPVDR